MISTISPLGSRSSISAIAELQVEIEQGHLPLGVTPMGLVGQGEGEVRRERGGSHAALGAGHGDDLAGLAAGAGALSLARAVAIASRMSGSSKGCGMKSSTPCRMRLRTP